MYVDEVDYEYECFVGFDHWWCVALVVVFVWWDCDPLVLVDFHAGHVFVLVVDDLVFVEVELERVFVILGGVELGVV